MYILKTMFDWIFPPSIECLRVREMSQSTPHGLYQVRNLNTIVALSSFKDESIRALIHEAKFHHNVKALKLLANLLDKYLEVQGDRFDVIIPIPLSKKRFRERGYNQVTSVLQSATTTIPITTNVLERQRHTLPQTDLPKAKRERNVRDAFGVAHPELIAGKRILLVDDVVTTGATLEAAKAALLPHKPASVTCLALAH